MLSENQFRFLNRTGQVERAEDWNSPAQEKLWLYNLHYFDDLNAEGSENRSAWHEQLVIRWIDENPAPLGNGWEPYPISLRAVNWIKWSLRGFNLEDSAISSLSLQLRWLRRQLEWHLLGNHLIANAKALIFGGLFFEGPEAEEWFCVGKRILDRELEEQVLDDGGHFELSPMYHLIVLEDLLDVINILGAYGLVTQRAWILAAERMLRWAKAMQHPDGEIPFFNDAAFSIAASPQEIRDYAVRLFDQVRDDSKACSMAQNNLGSSPSRLLGASGYVRLVGDDLVAFFDVGDVGPTYLPGHGHADSLSIELSLFGRRILVNSGVSLYGESDERQRQRSTDAHNTVTLNRQDSSEVWGGFRVARRARGRYVEYDLSSGSVVAEHDGYLRLRSRVIHQRKLETVGRQVLVIDNLRGECLQSEEHHVRVVWHFHPDVEVVHKTTCDNHSSPTKWLLHFKTADGIRKAEMIIHGASTVELESSNWHPEFGLTVPNSRLVADITRVLPVTLSTELRW